MLAAPTWVRGESVTLTSAAASLGSVARSAYFEALTVAGLGTAGQEILFQMLALIDKRLSCNYLCSANTVKVLLVEGCWGNNSPLFGAGRE